MDLKTPGIKFIHFLKQPNLNFLRFIGGVIILSLILLSVTLPNLEFNPGETIPQITRTQGLFQFNTKMDLTWMASLCLSGMILMFPASILLLVFSSEARRLFKRYSKGLAVWLVFLLTLRFYVLFFGNDQVILNSNGENISLSESFNPSDEVSGQKEAIEMYTSPEVSPEYAYIIGFVFIITIGLGTYLYWRRNQSKPDEMNDIFQATLRDISSGRQWDDAVINCYAKMDKLVRTRRRIERVESMTPGEFSKILVDEGLPVESVRQLTDLFEKARYSGRSSLSVEAKDAIDCLNEITQALGS